MLKNKFLAFASPFVLSAALLTSTTNIMAMEREDENIGSRHPSAKLDQIADSDFSHTIPSLNAEQENDPPLKKLYAHLFSERDIPQDLPARVALWNNIETLFPPKWHANSRRELVELLSDQSPETIAPIASLLSMGTYLEGDTKVPYAQSDAFDYDMSQFVGQLGELSSNHLKAVATHAEMLFPQKWNPRSRAQLIELLNAPSPEMSNQSLEKIAPIARILWGTYFVNHSKTSYAQSDAFDYDMSQFVEQLGELSSKQLEVIATHADVLFPKEWGTYSRTKLLRLLSNQSPERIAPIARLLSMGTYLKDDTKVPYAQSKDFELEICQFVQQLGTLSNEQLEAVDIHAKLLFPHGWSFEQGVQSVKDISSRAPHELPLFVATLGNLGSLRLFLGD